MNFINRFWKRVDVKKPDECWKWTPPLDSYGYGVICNNYKILKAHRISWELHFGPITNGLHCLHKCDEPSCVNPNHLFLGTHTDNVRDMHKKGRAPDTAGVANGNAKLNEDAVRNIRKYYAAGAVKKEWLASVYGVHRITIHQIVSGQTWGELRG